MGDTSTNFEIDDPGGGARIAGVAGSPGAAADTVLTSDGAGGTSWASGGGSQTVLSATVTVTSAQILALADTPVELVAAPGAGKTILLLQVASFTQMGDAYTLGDSPSAYVGAALNQFGSYIGCGSMLTALSDGTSPLAAIDIPPYGSETATAHVVNESAKLQCDDANPTGGDFGMTVTTIYAVIDVPS